MSLRTRLKQKGIVLAPGIFDALSGLLAERAGFEALYLSGASIAYTRHGGPDIGLVTMTEVAETLGAIRERVTLPLIVDADTGFGNARQSLLHLLLGAQCFDEQNIRARSKIGFRPCQCGIEALHRHRIGARNDERVITRSRIEGGLDFAGHFAWGYQCLAVEVAAALGQGLILELNR